MQAPFQNPLKTRADLQRLAVELWEPIEPAFRKGGALTLLGSQRATYGPRAETMEGFARALWGLAPLIAGGGGERSDWSLLRHILLEGTSSRGWGPMKDLDQRIVEAPAIALAILWARTQLWDPLPPEGRAQVAGWLARINRVRVIENNWLWFRVLTNASLRALGQDCDPDREAADLDLLDSMWHGEDGYSDGKEEHRDYYIPMAMHYYGLVYAGLVEGASPDRAMLLRHRAEAFMHSFPAWFTAQGASIPYGRSLQYRFAHGSLWAALAFSGVESQPWGVIKGALLRHLRWWLRQDIFTNTGQLSVGHGYHQPQLTECYASSAGPYWAQKSLLVLALPEEHPFWQAEEAPLPDLPSVQPVPEMRWILTRPQDGSDAVALTASQSERVWLRHNAAKYHKFAYSAAFAFSIPLGDATPELLAPDSMLALSDDGRHWRVREVSAHWQFQGETLISVWSPWPDVTIQTRLSPSGEGWHEREHRIVTPRALETIEGGFCVPRDPDVAAGHACGVGMARALSGGFESEILDEAGRRIGLVLNTEPGTHILWPLASLPALALRLEPGENILRCRVSGRLSGSTVDPDPVNQISRG